MTAVCPVRARTPPRCDVLPADELITPVRSLYASACLPRVEIIAGSRHGFFRANNRGEMGSTD